MKKILGIYFCIFIALNVLLAEPIDTIQAKKIAINFLKQNKAENTLNLNKVKLVSISQSNSENLYYTFGINNQKGFVIVAADNNVSPVLGYSLRSIYSLTNQPPAFQALMKSYEKQILYVKQHNLKADKNIQEKWNSYLSGSAKILKNGKGSVLPLLTTTWSQGCYYDTLCPIDYGSNYCEHAITGCVATALGQIMKYWNYPAQGKGSHTDDSSYTYGYLNVDFATEQYDWQDMPDSLNQFSSQKNIYAVGQLLYDCGVSIDMQYGPYASGAWLYSIPNALINYFGYSYDTKYISQSDYLNNHTMQDWINLLENELNNQRPVQYQGYDQYYGGHSFVCDGYDSNNYFDFNWGWGGEYDGYFDITNLNPGIFDFYLNQAAVIGIKPASVNNNTLALYTKITAPDTINCKNPFSINFNLINKGTGKFSGIIAAILVDNYNDMIIIDSTSTEVLNAGTYFANNINFSEKGLSNVRYGNYKLGIFYKTGSGEWFLADSSSYQNLMNVYVTGPMFRLKLNSVINVPSNIYQNDTINISYSIINYGSISFKGTILCKLIDEDYGYTYTLDSVPHDSIKPNGIQNFSFNAPIPNQIDYYYLEVIYQPTDSVPHIVPQGDYENPIFFYVEPGPTFELELNSPISIYPTGNLKQYDTISVSYSVINIGQATFKGSLICYLGPSYYNNYDVDSVPGITLKPNEIKNISFKYRIKQGGGNYGLSVYCWNINTFYPEEVYSGNYENPIYITINLSPDRYEPDNSQEQAYNLTYSVNDNQIEINTNGSNLDNIHDVDFYKVNLVPGYDYYVTANIQDYSNNDTLTGDVVFSYANYSTFANPDTVTWSQYFSSYEQAGFEMLDGGTAYFEVQPGYLGEMGTYLLSIFIRRTPAYSVNNLFHNSTNISAFPDPVSDNLNISINNSAQNSYKFTLYNSLGSIVYQKQTGNVKSETIDMESFEKGIYFLEVIDNNYNVAYKKKIIKL